MIVGQKVTASLQWDGNFSIATRDLLWSHPSGGPYVKNYVTDDSAGFIVEHVEESVGQGSDYERSLQFEYYYTSLDANANIGSIGCGGIIVTDPNNGREVPVDVTTSFYIEAAELVAYQNGEFMDSRWHVDNEGNKMLIDTWALPGVYPIQLTKVLVLQGFEVGLRVKAPKYGDGEIAFVQTVRSLSYKGSPVMRLTTGTEYFLDVTYPYGEAPGAVPTKKGIEANETKEVRLEDSPKTFLGHPVFANDTAINRADRFKSYGIYKPSGESIWVTLGYVSWGWQVNLQKNSSGWGIVLGTDIVINPTLTRPYTELVVWNNNINSVTWEEWGGNQND